MKKLFLIVIAFICSFGSSGQAKKQVTFEAKIANRNSDSISISTDGRGMRRIIPINKKGIFKDTLTVKEGMYRMGDGNETTELYLKNGYDLKLNMDAKQFDESIVYKGKGAAENNLLAKRILEDEKYYSQNVSELNEADFAKFLANKKQDDFERVNNKKLDPKFVIQEKKNSENSLIMFQSYYSKEKERQELYSKMNNSPSPSFDYINYNGGNAKLEDFKGKYVYIDVWATWCGPCRAEIPFLKKVEDKYLDKKIVFVSISVDQQKDFEKWKAFVKDKSLGGVQLFANKDSYFIKSYNITGIPRFILIDPNGIIVKADAARPSDLELQKELDSLLK
jgi:thiol-disulfide isomerase/thioredoxin